VVVRQHSRQRGRIVGTFELLIPVRDAGDILPSEARLLAVLKSIALRLRPNSLWFPVFTRYLAITGERVRGLGGQPTLIGPSPHGHVPDGALPDRPVDSVHDCCQKVTRGVRTLTILLALALLGLLVLILVLILRG
jgi:hypothetical protein